MDKKSLFIGALLIVSLIGGSSAALFDINDVSELFDNNAELPSVTTYSMDSSSGYVIAEVLVSHLSIGKNQSHILNSGGNIYLLEINSSSGGYFVQNFHVSLTNPNGSVSTQDLTAYSLGTGYETIIQSVTDIAPTNTTNVLDVDLSCGLSPLNARFEGPLIASYLYYNQTKNIPFTSVSGTLDEPSNVFIFQCSEANFDDYVANGINSTALVNAEYSALYSWTWDMFLAVLEKIPVVGPAFVTFLEMFGTTITEILFWLVFIFQNIPSIIVGGEIVIIITAGITAGKKNGKEFVRNWISYNIRAVKGFLWILEWGWSLVMRVVEIVAVWIR